MNHSSDPPTPFFKGEQVNFDYLLRRGSLENEEGGGMV